MRAEITESEIYIIPENRNEEYALRKWNEGHFSGKSFILEVQNGPIATHGNRYRFERQMEQEVIDE